MHTFKDALCLFGIYIAYGIAGHLDFDEAQMLEEAQAPLLLSESSDNRPLPNALVAPTVPPWPQPVLAQAELEPNSETEPTAPCGRSTIESPSVSVDASHWHKTKSNPDTAL